MVPMMTCRPLQFQARFASATSLVAVLGTGAVAAVGYAWEGQVDPVGAGIIAAFAMLTAPAGARATMRISSATLKRIMGLFILVVAPAVPLKDRLLSTQADCDPAALQHAVGASTSPGFLSLAPSERAPYAATLAGAGSIAGFLSGLMGIGGGIIVTPILAISSGMSQHAVVGTSMVAMIFPSAVSLYTHHRLGNVRWPVGRMLLGGSALGACLGVQVALAPLLRTKKWRRTRTRARAAADLRDWPATGCAQHGGPADEADLRSGDVPAGAQDPARRAPLTSLARKLASYQVIQ